MHNVPTRQGSLTERFILLVLVAILLNVGLFFVLVLIAPLVSGLVVGYFLEEYKKGTLAGFIGAILSYSVIMLITEYLIGFTTDPFVILQAILIMGAIGAFGGLLGAFARPKRK